MYRKKLGSFIMFRDRCNDFVIYHRESKRKVFWSDFYLDSYYIFKKVYMIANGLNPEQTANKISKHHKGKFYLKLKRMAREVYERSDEFLKEEDLCEIQRAKNELEYLEFCFKDRWWTEDE